jgi:hypothetical protein
VLELLRKKCWPAPMSSPLAQKPSEATPALFDAAEQNTRGETTEAREASYMSQIEGVTDNKLLDALSKECERDRLLVSTAIDRIKKRIDKRRSRLAIDNAPRQSHGIDSQEVAKWKGKLRGATTENELDTIVQEASLATGLSMNDLDKIDQVVIDKRKSLQSAQKAMQDLQVNPLF